GVQVCRAIFFGIEYSRGRRPYFLAQPDMDIRIAEDVLNPLRFEAVFRQNVDKTIGFDVPDFDLSGKSRLPACGRDVNELFVGRWSGQWLFPPSIAKGSL